ncbi:MAG: HNH endonuclease [Elusimicrobia bacterium]|nr:HNH endonuclease [Elusimicrobiota bacterium]
MAPAKSAALIASCALARPSAGCKWCGKPLPPRRRTWCGGRCAAAFWNNHWWPRARRAVRRRDKYRCVTCGKTGKLEVNHRIPCRGAHGILSCAHHLDNLEMLCVPCHRAHTSTITRAHRVK